MFVGKMLLAKKKSLNYLFLFKFSRRNIAICTRYPVRIHMHIY